MADNHGPGTLQTIPLRPVLPPSEAIHRQFVIASLSLAVLTGFALAIYLPLERLLGAGRPERTVDLVQGHGQVQLLGFAGLYVMGVSLRLLPRFAGARLQMESLAPFILWSMVAGLVLRAAAVPWSAGGIHAALLIASTLGVLFGSGSFLLVVIRTLSAGARHRDASSLAFLLGALAHSVASAVGAFAAMESILLGVRALPYLPDVAITQLQLLGFLLMFIVGVALRALPVLVGHERPQRGALFLPPALLAAVSVHATALLLLHYVSYSRGVAMVADAALLLPGLVLFAMVWRVGVLRPRANRARPASQPALWLVRAAFAWLTIAALLMVYFGASSLASRELLSPAEFDAVRHTLGLGLVTNLVLGMSLLILPEFAIERQRRNRQRLLAYALAVLINASVVLRVGPDLAGGVLPYDARNLSMSMAGLLAEVAMVLFFLYFLRLVRTGTHGLLSTR